MKDIDLRDYRDEQAEYGREYTKLGLKVSGIIIFFCIALFLGSMCMRRIIFLHGAFYPDNRQYFFAFFAGLAMAIGLIVLFEKRIVLKHTPEKYKKYVSAQIDWDAQNYNKFRKVISKITAVILILFSLCLAFAGTSDVGLYDDHFTEVFTSFDVESYDYNDVEIYSVQGYYISDYEYYKYDELNYAFKYGGGSVYFFDKTEPNGKLDEFIKNIVADYDKEIIEIVDDSFLYNGEI